MERLQNLVNWSIQILKAGKSPSRHSESKHLVISPKKIRFHIDKNTRNTDKLSTEHENYELWIKLFPESVYFGQIRRFCTKFFNISDLYLIKDDTVPEKVNETIVDFYLIKVASKPEEHYINLFESKLNSKLNELENYKTHVLPVSETDPNDYKEDREKVEYLNELFFDLKNDGVFHIMIEEISGDFRNHLTDFKERLHKKQKKKFVPIEFIALLSQKDGALDLFRQQLLTSDFEFVIKHLTHFDIWFETFMEIIF